MKKFFCVLVAACVAAPPKREIIVFDTEWISEEIKLGWDPRLVALVNAQKNIDMEHGMFAPNLDYELYSDPKFHYEFTPMGRLTLNRKISSGPFSAIFTVHENPHLVVKYQSNCGRTKSPHPALLDFWGLRESARANVQNIPSVYFVSPAVRMPRKRTTKCAFGIEDSKWVDCRSSSVRFLVMEKFGVSIEHIHQSTGQAFAPKIAIRYGIKLIETLKQIHLAGIIHGDIHSGNLLVDKTNEIRLIDFDRFRFIHPSGIIFRISPPFARVHPLLSPWEIEGFAGDVRDDIFRAISLIAHLLHPSSPYDLILEHLKPQQLFLWKTRGMLFSAMPASFVGDNWGVEDPVTVTRLREIFDEILTIARSPAVQIPVTHNLIIALFQRIEWILSIVTVS